SRHPNPSRSLSYQKPSVASAVSAVPPTDAARAPRPRLGSPPLAGARPALPSREVGAWGGLAAAPRRRQRRGGARPRVAAGASGGGGRAWGWGGGVASPAPTARAPSFPAPPLPHILSAASLGGGSLARAPPRAPAAGAPRLFAGGGWDAVVPHPPIHRFLGR